MAAKLPEVEGWYVWRVFEKRDDMDAARLMVPLELEDQGLENVMFETPLEAKTFKIDLELAGEWILCQILTHPLGTFDGVIVD